MRLVLPLYLMVLAAAACSAPVITDSGSDGYIIRYININVIYDYELSKSNEAVSLKAKREEILKKIRSGESVSRGDDNRELDYYRSELVKLDESEKKLKAVIYSKIKKAVESVAERHEVDFMLGTGEGVVYSRPVFDLTSEVIAELEKMGKNSSPVWK